MKIPRINGQLSSILMCRAQKISWNAYSNDKSFSAWMTKWKDWLDLFCFFFSKNIFEIDASLFAGETTVGMCKGKTESTLEVIGHLYHPS